MKGNYNKETGDISLVLEPGEIDRLPIETNEINPLITLNQGKFPCDREYEVKVDRVTCQHCNHIWIRICSGLIGNIKELGDDEWYETSYASHEDEGTLRIKIEESL